MPYESCLVAGSVIAIDRLTKHNALRPRRWRVNNRSLPQAKINTGAPICRLSSPMAVVCLSVICAAGLVLGLAQGLPFWQQMGVFGVSVALGGASSNLLDRLAHGGTVDFISLGRWPMFNLADLAIVCGALVALPVWV
jgi:lipoprotein signal peptidase